jgi:PTH1 family peptidyl-tRNA hydrolase
MKYIIGLGNPGEKYQYNRHNVAWLVFNALDLADWKFDKYMNAEFVGTQIEEEIVLYIKPQTFMNNSGEVLATLKKEKEFSHKNIILIYDDIDLAFGEIRISHNRGDGGHNGVKSITEHLKTKDTVRIRVGVSKRLEDGRLIKPNVLSNFPQNERDIIKSEITPKIENIIKSLIKNGLEKTMSEFNKKK